MWSPLRVNLSMRLGHIELFCRNTLATQRFFIDGLGFEIVVEQPGGFVWLQSGSIEILLRPNLHEQSPIASYQQAHQALVIYADDLRAARARLESASIPILGTDGSPDCLTFQDPDGRWYQLVEHS